MVRASSASTRALSAYLLRRGSSCTVSVTSTVPSPSTWMPPPSFTSSELTSSAPVRSATSRAISADFCHADHAGTLVVDDEGRAEVAHPELVERCLHLLDVRAEHPGGALALGRVDDHRDGFELRGRVRDGRPGRVGLLGRRGVIAEGDA